MGATPLASRASTARSGHVVIKHGKTSRAPSKNSSLLSPRTVEPTVGHVRIMVQGMMTKPSLAAMCISCELENLLLWKDLACTARPVAGNLESGDIVIDFEVQFSTKIPSC